MNRYSFAVAAMVFLISCGEQDIRLPGERLDIRSAVEAPNQVRDISLPTALAGSSWTHRNGSAQHTVVHRALASNPTQLFAVDIGEGDSRRARITADPVVDQGVVYTLDARAQVTATSTAGAPIWSTALSPRLDNLTDASGGGLAVGGGILFATTGFGTLVALDTATGNQLWTQDLDAPGTSAPTFLGDLVYTIGRDGTAWALEATSGRIRWQITGTPSIGNFAGGAGAAVNDDIVVFPFSSGEVIGAFPQGGLRRWSTVISGDRLGQAVASITDISGDPVLANGRVYVGNFSGRVAALNAFNGDRIWTAEEGAINPVWVAGGSVFLINDLNELVRLDEADGSTIWRVSLPQFTETRLRQQRTIFAHFGPVLAGGRLLVASTDGLIRSFDPVSGAEIGQLTLPAGAASQPVVVGETLYVVTKDGQLVAFR